MGTAELTHARNPCATAGTTTGARVHAPRIAATYAGIWALTGLAVLIGVAAPGLAPSGRPHPTLHGTLHEAALIAMTNARVLSAPFLLALFRFPADRRSRWFGDLLVFALFAGNPVRVGLALGRDGHGLLPYLPQLPVEWLAAAVTGAAWLVLRTGDRSRTAVAYFAAVLALVTVAAAIEATYTPHTAARDRVAHVEPSGALRSAGPMSLRQAGGGVPAPDSAPGPSGRFKVADAPFPSLRSVPLGRHRRTSASSTTPGSRKGGTRK